ncbi:hypothetical protein ACIGD1_18260 [Streptomyces sp. NPDC085612]|uniref:hypothetical protein n=1 Tax=Streptomyces sp. NPDC085612 TaxID=3365732 RepID=UPI0037CCF54A
MDRNPNGFANTPMDGGAIRSRRRLRRLGLGVAALLAASLGIAPAAASAVVVPAGPEAVPAAPSCRLLAGSGAKPAGDASYKLHLGGFPAKQAVRVDGPRTSFRAAVNAKGELDRAGLRHGAYTVTYQNKRVVCVVPPAQKPGTGSVKVTKAEVVVLTPAGTAVDCTKPTTAEFDGKITATGPGKVRFHWTLSTSPAPTSPGTADFPAGSSTQTLLHVAEVPPAAAGATTVTVYATLHLPDQKMTARSGAVTFTCTK